MSFIFVAMDKEKDNWKVVLRAVEVPIGEREAEGWAGNFACLRLR